MASSETFRIGRVFSTTFQAIFQRWQSVGLFALIVSVVTSIVHSFTSMQGMADYDPAVPGTAATMFSSPLTYIGLLLGLLSYTFVQAGSLYGFTKRGDDEDSSVVDCLNAALRYFLPLVGATLLFFLGFLGGYILFVVPAFIIGTMWSVSGAVLVAEGLGPTECLSRSRALTKGIRWPIFGCLVVFGIAYFVLAFGSQGFRANGLLLLYKSSPVLGMIATTVSTTITGLFANSFFAALYLETVLVKEGGDTRELAKIFA